jgi:hypothetical protein
VDRAKTFYTEQMGFHLLVDVSGQNDFRVVQLEVNRAKPNVSRESAGT